MMKDHENIIANGAYVALTSIMQKEIESLTAVNERLRSALEEAILWGEFMDLCEKWRKVLEETKQ